MRIAVVAQQASAGGGTRFLRPLLRGLTAVDDSLQITVFANSAAADEYGVMTGLAEDRIDVIPVSPVLYAVPPDPPGGRREALRRSILRVAGRDWRSVSRRAGRALGRRLKAYDVVYLAWPFFIEPFDVPSPVVATFHDFNFKHGFGSLTPSAVQVLENEVGSWVERADVSVTSCDFMRDEIERYYGDQLHDQRVVRLSTFASTSPDAEDIRAVRRRFGLSGDYVICPSHVNAHKNIPLLMRAYSEVRRGGGPPLVLMGNGTGLLADVASIPNDGGPLDALRAAVGESGMRCGRDYLALGYVSDADADALIAGARLLVAPSLYEAGSGPAIDAWALGTPVAMSDIPPFREHLGFLGVEARLFDPHDQASIASTVLAALADAPALDAMSLRSRKAMERYTWRDAATGYLDAFRAATVERERRRH